MNKIDKATPSRERLWDFAEKFRSRKQSPGKSLEEEIGKLLGEFWISPDAADDVAEILGSLPSGAVAVAIEQTYPSLPPKVHRELWRWLNSTKNLIPKVPAALLKFDSAATISLLSQRTRRSSDRDMSQELAASLRGFFNDAGATLDKLNDPAVDKSKAARLIRDLIVALHERGKSPSSIQRENLFRILEHFQTDNADDARHLSEWRTRISQHKPLASRADPNREPTAPTTKPLIFESSVMRPAKQQSDMVLSSSPLPEHVDANLEFLNRRISETREELQFLLYVRNLASTAQGTLTRLASEKLELEKRLSEAIVREQSLSGTIQKLNEQLNSLVTDLETLRPRHADSVRELAEEKHLRISERNQLQREVLLNADRRVAEFKRRLAVEFQIPMSELPSQQQIPTPEMAKVLLGRLRQILAILAMLEVPIDSGAKS
jgi:hypothetical protein